VHPAASRGTNQSGRRSEGTEVTATILFCMTGWLLGWWALGRPRRVAELPVASLVPSTSGPVRRVTVVIPARNEELSIGALLGDLERGRPPGTRVVVVDDHSHDATAAIAAGFGFVEVMDAPDLPTGWTGKCWACHSGAAGVDDGVLVFLDADVRLDDGALARIVDEQERIGGLVSVQPWHDAERPYEKMSALFNVVAVMGTAAGSRREPTGAFGPVMVTSVEDYRLMGGHAAVSDEVVEDLALAQRFRRAGLGSTILTGSGGVRFRMYPGGFRTLAEGWTKNFASGARSTRPLRLAAIVFWIASMGSAALAVVDGIQGDVPAWVAAVLYAAFTLQLVVMFRQVGRFGWPTAMCFPVLVVFFLVVFVRSLWRTHVRRAVRWRGRVVPVGAARG
jgi:4,4'-diaponeurosporenoate glycosyltransferase